MVRLRANLLGLLTEGAPRGVRVDLLRLQRLLLRLLEWLYILEKRCSGLLFRLVILPRLLSEGRRLWNGWRLFLGGTLVPLALPVNRPVIRGTPLRQVLLVRAQLAFIKHQNLPGSFPHLTAVDQPRHYRLGHLFQLLRVLHRGNPAVTGNLHHQVEQVDPLTQHGQRGGVDVGNLPKCDQLVHERVVAGDL